MCFQWMNDKLKKMNCFDYSLVKLCVFTFTLMLAKLWSPILSLPWYCYGIVFAAAYAYLIIRIFGKR